MSSPKLLALDVLHGDVANAAFVADVEDLGDIGMGDGRGGAAFLNEAFGQRGDVRRSAGRIFSATVRLSRRVLREEDLTHPALPELSNDSIVRERLRQHG